MSNLSILCPECNLEVALRPSTCPCALCKRYVYLSQHFYRGKECFGSGHSVLRTDKRVIVSADSANVHEAQPVETSEKSANNKNS